jgi:hypothetical protein
MTSERKHRRNDDVRKKHRRNDDVRKKQHRMHDVRTKRISNEQSKRRDTPYHLLQPQSLEAQALERGGGGGGANQENYHRHTMPGQLRPLHNW